MFAPFELTPAWGDPATAGFTVTAWPTRTPGLCVHELPDGPGWVIAHTRSGALLFVVDGPEQAMLAAELIADRTGLDFSLPVADLQPALHRLHVRASDYGRVPAADAMPADHPRYAA